MPTVSNICAGAAEDITELADNECLISVGEEFGDFWKLKVDGPRVLRLRFSDVRDFTFQEGVFLRPINLKECFALMDFVEKWSGYNMIVNCAAGVSRSGAIALWLHACYGYELKFNFFRLSEPNPTVLGLLLSEYYKRATSDDAS